MTKNELIKELSRLQGVKFVSVLPTQSVEVAVQNKGTSTFAFDEMVDGPKVVLVITLDE